MGKVIWTRFAVEDLKQIHAYISTDSVFYAERLIQKLIERVDILQRFPLAGRVVPEKEDEIIRELIEGNYRIFYFVEDRNSVFILRIHHGAKKITA